MPEVALAPIPKWYFPDNFGRPLGAGKMFTYSQINPSLSKPVYQDHLGTLKWTNPILFNLNGLQGPFYWETNALNPDDTYFIEIRDKDDVLQFTIENFSPTGGGGGGGGNIFVSLKNLISNNIFYNNNRSSSVDIPISLIDSVIAPGPFVGMNPSKSDIRFIKSDLLQTDFLNFVDFTLGDDPFINDVTPVQYLRYKCTASPSAQSIKVAQFPITSKVANLDNQEVTFTVWARRQSGANTLKVYDLQYFGSGGSPSAENRTLRASFDLTDTWAKYPVTFPVATTSGKTLGTCGDDAYFIQVEFPLDATSEIWLAKPCLYLGSLDPGKDFETNDQIMAQIAGPRPGDIRTSINNFTPFGWVEMNDGTIGNTGSGATNRANVDTFPLYKTIYTNVSDAFAPVSGGRTGNPENDFAAGKTLTLTRTAGRALAGVGQGSGLTLRSIGEFVGGETGNITIDNMPAHNHPGSVAFLNGLMVDPGSLSVYGPGGVGSHIDLTITSQGSGTPISLMQPTVFYRIFAKL